MEMGGDEMLQVIKKWRIILYFNLSEKNMTFFIHDNFYSNMLGKLREVSFDLEPSKIEILEVTREQQLNSILNNPKDA